MELRKLTIDDYEKLADLWSRAELSFRPKGRDSKEAITAQMTANPEFFVGAFEGNHLVGAVIISSDTRKGWINRLAVDPAYRRHGVAKMLIGESERILRKYGLKMFCVLIDDDNVVSKDVFKKCGYVEHRDIIYFSKRESDEI
jgi:ribosomal protein S18 acetylase RimI-like enzyme